MRPSPAVLRYPPVRQDPGTRGKLRVRIGNRKAVLSTLPASREARSLALGVVLISVAVFLAAAPFAKVPLMQIGAFLPIYQSCLLYTSDAADE